MIEILQEYTTSNRVRHITVAVQRHYKPAYRDGQEYEAWLNSLTGKLTGIERALEKASHTAQCWIELQVEADSEEEWEIAIHKQLSAFQKFADEVDTILQTNYMDY